MTTFVLVPGFWLGAWAWDGVAARLRADGHEVHAVTPLGIGERATTADVSADDQVADIVAILGGRTGPVVLVGHSGAGPVVVAAAEKARERVEHLVLVDTGPMPDGMAHIDFHEPSTQEWIRARIAAHDGWQEALGEHRTILVLDVGGGTTDFSTISVRPTDEGVGLERISDVRDNPLPWLAELMDIKKEQNFFEGRVTEYQKSTALGNIDDDEL